MEAALMGAASNCNLGSKHVRINLGQAHHLRHPHTNLKNTIYLVEQRSP